GDEIYAGGYSFSTTSWESVTFKPLKGAVIMISKYIAPIFPIKQLFMHI
ncbi:MAG: hypothetical protein ACI9F2_000702, partial [Lysobacterales bacterium]